MADGFKVADAFVDVALNLDAAAIEGAARRTGERAGASLKASLADAGKGGGEGFGSSFASASESRVRDSRGRFISAFDGIGDDAGKSSGGKFSMGFGGKLLSGLAGTGAKMGSMLTDTLGSVGGKGGPWMMAGVTAAVAAGGPTIAAVLGGALTAGVALAAVGVGVAASMRHPAVKGAAVGLKADIMSEIGKIGQEWAPTVVSAIDQIKGAVPGIGMQLRQALAPAMGYVKPLVDGFTGLVRNIMPGFGTLIARAGPVVAALKVGLETVGTSIGKAFETLGGSTNEFAGGLQYAMTLLGKGVEFAAELIAWLAQGFKHVLNIVEPLSRLMSYLPGIGGQFAEWNEEIRGLQATVNGTNPALKLAGENVSSMGKAMSDASQSNESMATRTMILNGTLAQGADAAGDLKSAMDALNGAAQSAEEAEIAFMDSVQKATDAMKENGRTTDMNTEKGRANRSALLDLARAGQTHAQAVYDQTAATRGTVAAEGAAQGAYAQSRNSLIQTAQRMGMTKKEATAYADEIMAIPKAWSTNVNVNTGNAVGKLSEVQNYMKSLRDKNIYVRVHVSKQGEVLHGGQASAYSAGGPVFGRGVKGVDSVPATLAPGEHVITAREVDAAGGHNAIAAFRAALVRGTGSGAGRPQALPTRGTTLPTSGGGSSGGSGGSGGGNTYNIGTVLVDPAGVRSIQQLADLVSGVVSTSRTIKARTATAAGL